MAVIAGLDGFAGLSPMAQDQSCCQQLKVVSRFLASVKARSKHLQPVPNSFFSVLEGLKCCWFLRSPTLWNPPEIIL